MAKATILLIGNHLPTKKHNKNIWHYLAEKLTARGWNVIRTSSRNNQVLRLLDMVLTVIHQRQHYALAQIDVFSGKAFIFAEVCTRILSWLKKPIILTLHGGRLPDFAESHPDRMARVLQRANVVVSPSGYHQIELHKYHSDIRLIPNPINLSAFRFRHRAEAKPTLVWVRAFHDIYNPSMAAQVLAELAPDFPEIRLRMIGPDKNDGSLAKMLILAARLGIRERIEIAGSVPHEQVATCLDKMDVFINTTNFDTAPNSLLEAMACGLCIVTTDVGGIPYMVDHGQEVLLVPPDDAPAMAAAVRRVLTEPGLAAQLSKNARAKAETLDWEALLPEWEALFIEVLKDHHGEA